MKFKGNYNSFIDYLFWILFVLYTNPGGIFVFLGEDGVDKVGSIDIQDYLFALLFGCFLLISYKSKIRNKTYKKIIKYFIIFGLYYFIIFGFLVPIYKETINYSPFDFLKKSRKTVYSLLIFVIVYRFYLRSYMIFFKVFIFSSIFILTLFITTFMTGIEILPIEKANRGFTNLNRIFLINYGLMPLLKPMGIILIVFRNNIRWKRILFLGFALMAITDLLSLTRRDILGIFIYLFLAIALYNYFKKRALISFDSVKKIVSVLLFSFILGFFASLAFPKYMDAAGIAIDESVNVIQYGRTSKGSEDARLGLGKDIMQNLIISNPFFGTGFDNRWRTNKGDRLGYEASDYPLLGAIAMMGIFGILVFLPIYIVLVKVVVYDIKFIRNNKVNYDSFEFFIFMFFILYFVFELLQYVNWFLPVSLSHHEEWYVHLALYLASREIFYNSRKELNQIKNS